MIHTFIEKLHTDKAHIEVVELQCKMTIYAKDWGSLEDICSAKTLISASNPGIVSHTPYPNFYHKIAFLCYRKPLRAIVMIGLVVL